MKSLKDNVRNEGRMQLVKVKLHDKLSENVSCEILTQDTVYNDKVITLSDKHSLLQNI